MPHSEETKAKISAIQRGRPCPWKHRPTLIFGGEILYRCGSCKKFLCRESFPPEKKTLLGIKPQCRICRNARNIAKRNPVVARISNQRSEAKRRAQKAGSGGIVRAKDWRQLLEILGSKCLNCVADKTITQDHIIPLSKGGMHHPSNLQPLCRRCNEIKQARVADYRTPEQILAISNKWPLQPEETHDKPL